jgi:predicted unusual protein kinase regulating ubiquinone biosynthesis (AarF/ABC1/UbiB family)
MKTKTKAYLLLINEIHNNNIFDLYNTFLMFYNFFKISYIFLSQFLIFHSKNIIYKFQKLPYLERLELIKNITYKLEELNIVYVKVFQSLCLDKNILNEQEREFLIKYTDSVPYNSDDINYELLDTLESKYNIRLEDGEVINSGIVGIVFKGIHGNDNDSKVVIKILKNNIEQRLNQVFNEIEFITNIIKYIPYLNNFNANKLFLDNKESLLNQIDFINEVKNIKLFKEKNKNLEEYIIPHVYEEITNNYNNIIVMENIQGLKIDQIKKMDPQIKNEFGKLFVKFGVISILYNSAIHNDLHAGNVFFYINDNNNNNNDNNNNNNDNNDNNSKLKYQLGLIDFGICVFPNRENQNVYYTFFYEMLVNQKFDNMEYFIKNIINEKKYFEEMSESIKFNLINESIKLFKQYSLISLDAYFLFLFCKILKKYKLSITKESNQIFFGCFTVNALANELCINFNETQKEVLNNLKNINNLIEI